MGRINKEKDKGLDTYGTGYPTPLRKEVLESVAYKVLAPTEKLILADMLRAYFRRTHWDKVPLPDGMTFTWTQCQEIVSENSFQSAVRRICRNGFFSAPPEIQERRPCAPRRYGATTKWRDYKATEQEAKRLSRHLESKTVRTTAKRQRRNKFRENLPDAESTPKKCADTTRRIVADTVSLSQRTSTKIVADRTAKLTDLDHQNCCRSFITRGYGHCSSSIWHLFDEERSQTDIVRCARGEFG